MDVVLLRIPFSHFCKKVEWALTRKGIPYSAKDVTLFQMQRAHRFTPHGTVPTLAADELLLGDSHDILEWLERVAPSPPLYPKVWAKQVREWEAWADEEVAPVVRRQAYRLLHRNPRLAKRFGAPFWMRTRLAKRVYLAILKHYKARRYDDTDPEALVAAFGRIGTQLEHQQTGLLFGEDVTAADIACAALVEPAIILADELELDVHPAYSVVSQWLDHVRPMKTGLTRRSKFGQRDESAWTKRVAKGRPRESEET